MVFSPPSGTAVLEYGPAEILPPVGAKWKALRVSADPVAKPAAHTRAESRGTGPSKADAAERQTLCWRKPDSNHRFRGGRARRLVCRFSSTPTFRLAENQPEATLKAWSCHAGRFESCSLQQRVRRNRWLGNACGAGTMLHGAPTVHLGIKHFHGPAAGVGWQRA